MIVIRVPSTRTAKCAGCKISMILTQRTWVVCDKPVCNYCYWHIGDLRAGQLR